MNSPRKAMQRKPGQKFRRVRLGSGTIVQRPLSPESYFIRTGKTLSGLSEKRAKALGTRFLGNAWFRTAEERKTEGPLHYPLPSFRQRLMGGRLPKADKNLIDRQIGFALTVFCRHLSKSQMVEANKQTRRFVLARQLSVSSALRENTRTGIKQMREQGKELFANLHGKGILGTPALKGTVYAGLMQDPTGRTYFARGISLDKLERFVPIHETMHVLAEIGVIKRDVPFAEAAQRLYALEHGLKPDPRIRNPTLEEFDRKTRPGEKKTGGITGGERGGDLSEPRWTYPIGDRIGQWVFQNLPEKKRWQYLYERCVGKSHSEALKNIKR